MVLSANKMIVTSFFLSCSFFFTHMNFFFFDRDYLRDGLFSGKRISKGMSWLLTVR